MGFPRGEVKHVAIDENGAAANSIVTAVSGKSIRIMALALVADGAVDITMQDDTGGGVKVIMGPFKDLQVGLVLPYSEEGWGQTNQGQDLDMLLGAGVQVTGCLVYTEV